MGKVCNKKGRNFQGASSSQMKILMDCPGVSLTKAGGERSNQKSKGTVSYVA